MRNLKSHLLFKLTNPYLMDNSELSNISYLWLINKIRKRNISSSSSDTNANKKAFYELPGSDCYKDKNANNNSSDLSDANANKKAFYELPGSDCYVDSECDSDAETVREQYSDSETVRESDSETVREADYESETEGFSSDSNSQSSGEDNPFYLEGQLSRNNSQESESSDGSLSSRTLVDSSSSESSSSFEGSYRPQADTGSDSGWGSWGSTEPSEGSVSSGTLVNSSSSEPSNSSENSHSLSYNSQSSGEQNPFYLERFLPNNNTQASESEASVSSRSLPNSSVPSYTTSASSVDTNEVPKVNAIPNSNDPSEPSNGSDGSDSEGSLGKIRLVNPRPGFGGYCKSMSTHTTTNTDSTNPGCNDPLLADKEPTGTSLDNKELYGEKAKYEGHPTIYETFSREEILSINKDWKFKTLDKKGFYEMVDKKCSEYDNKTSLLKEEYLQDAEDKTTFPLHKTPDNIAENIGDFEKLGEHGKDKIKY